MQVFLPSHVPLYCVSDFRNLLFQNLKCCCVVARCHGARFPCRNVVPHCHICAQSYMYVRCQNVFLVSSSAENCPSTFAVSAQVL